MFGRFEFSECVTDLDQQYEMIIFESILNTWIEQFIEAAGFVRKLASV